jgi:hypothetical protein
MGHARKGLGFSGKVPPWLTPPLEYREPERIRLALPS